MMSDLAIHGYDYRLPITDYLYIAHGILYTGWKDKKNRRIYSDWAALRCNVLDYGITITRFLGRKDKKNRRIRSPVATYPADCVDYGVVITRFLI